uniref:Uncharacterized mitochondrial protein AtMg00810-like n=1 Tax=Tanacetum cinerariifolium TaxID=118510 RepID=A0A6L2JZ83_TANCI|nr:uncharacterized mitochondrial protein AtMg00810-like [Tanacetum cinerariifolium]
MKMEQYPTHTDYALWEVILNGNGKVHMTKDEASNEVEVPPVTAQQILAKTRERKAKSTPLMAILDEHLARLHGIKDAKTLWAAIKTRFGGGLDKGYDRFQRLLSLLKIHGADNLDIDDLYNNLKVYKADIKGSSGSSSHSQNVAFVSAESTSSTNELNAAYSVSTATCHISQAQAGFEDLKQIDQDDLEEMDLKWHVAMLSIRVKRIYKKSRRKLEFNGKEPVGFDKTKVEKEGTLQGIAEQSKIQGTWVEMLEMQEAEAINFALMAFTSNPLSSSSSNSEFNEKEVLDVKEEEVTETVFDNRLSDEENSLANDRFKKDERYHAVPHPLTGNYMPPKPDLSFVGLDDFIYKFKISEIVSSLTKDVKDAPETSTVFVENPKEVRTSAHLICQPLQMLHMDLFGPTSVMSINHKKYCLLVTDDFFRALVTKPHHKTLYELLNGRSPRLDFMRPFGYLVTILNTLDPLGKFEGLVDEGFLVGYSVTSKAFRVFNIKTRKVEENLHGNKLIKMQVYKILMAMQLKIVVEPVNKEDQAYRDELDRLMSQEKEVNGVADTLRKELMLPVLQELFNAGGPSFPHPDAFIPDDTLLHIPDEFHRGAYFLLGLQVKQSEEGIFISQDMYIAEILKKFNFSSMRTASTPIETQKPLVKDEEAVDVDVHLYRSMIGSLMYLTASRPDIMFEIFWYHKAQPKLGLWYPKDSLFDLEAYSDSDYAGANLDKKSVTPPNGAWTEYVFGGVTLLSISSTKHKERPLRVRLKINTVVKF